MLKLLLATVLSSSALLAAVPAMADDEHADRPLTIAVFGDWPYSQNLLDRAVSVRGLHAHQVAFRRAM